MTESTISLEVNKDEMTIMGIPFDNSKEFNAAWYAISSSMMEGWKPRVEDVIGLRSRAIALRNTTKRGELDA